ncbi:MAG TPA: NUDIX domain-containing protein [Allosphingosinicella sp.]|jgi:8-oxo-dGTP pyrophosphatase MutT (NUDIX family)
MRWALNALHQAKTQLLKLLRIRTRGVRVMVFNPAGEVLLIRHTYGRSDLYHLPGGGIRPWESPEHAAHRETREEAGCTLADLMPVSIHLSLGEGRRDTVHLFSAQSEDRPIADGVEVEEARFFALDALPATLSPATWRRLQEHLGKRSPDGHW